MNTKELRKAADFCKAAYTAGSPLKNIAEYLESCADALDAGPVAWHYDGRDQIEVYPLAVPAQAQPLRLPEPMTNDEMFHLLRKTLSNFGADKPASLLEQAIGYAIEAETLRRVKKANE